MIRFLRRYQKALFVSSIGILLVGIFVGLGGYLLSGNDNSEAVASVGSVKIPYARFVSKVNQYEDALREHGTNLTDDDVKKIKQSMLREMIVDELLAQKADEMGIVVTDQDLARDIESTPLFQQGQGQGFNQELYFHAVRSVFGETPQQYEKERRRTLEAVRLKMLVLESVKLTQKEVADTYAEANKGSMKGFDKKKLDFASRLQELRAMDIINYYLRQLVTQVPIKTFLEQREAEVSAG